MARMPASSTEDDLSRAIRESLETAHRPPFLFAGLENISEEEQLAHLLTLSAQEASNDIAASVNGHLTPEEVVPQLSQRAHAGGHGLRDQFDQWKRMSVAERSSLILTNRNFDSEEASVAELPLPGRREKETNRDSTTLLVEERLQEDVDEDLKLAIQLSREPEPVSQNCNSGRYLVEPQVFSTGDRSRSGRREEVRQVRATSNVRLEDYKSSRLTEEEELNLALKISREASLKDRSGYSRYSSPSTSRHQSPAVNPTSIYNPEKQPTLFGGRRFIVIDGCNVGHAHAHHKFFSFRGVLICIEFFQLKKHEVVVILPQGKYNYASREDREIMDNLIQTDILVFTPRRRLPDGTVVNSYDDLFIIKLAAQRKGIIVSNDQFRDVRETNPEYVEQINKRLLPFTWHEDTFMIADDPLGRGGPNIEEFLTYP